MRAFLGSLKVIPRQAFDLQNAGSWHLTAYPACVVICFLGRYGKSVRTIKIEARAG